ncbi:MAG: hypothetical protein WDN76_04305 [Alphaproteobacteria bacterium]
MRHAALAAALLLAGCASAPPNTVGVIGSKLPRSHGVKLTNADRTDPTGALRRAGAADAMTPEGAHILFGTGDIERGGRRRRDPDLPHGHLRAGAGLRRRWRGRSPLGAVEAAARDQRALRPSLEQCVTEALARRVAS